MPLIGGAAVAVRELSAVAISVTIARCTFVNLRADDVLGGAILWQRDSSLSRLTVNASSFHQCTAGRGTLFLFTVVIFVGDRRCNWNHRRRCYNWTDSAVELAVPHLFG